MLGVDCTVQTAIEHTRDACMISLRIGHRRHFSSFAAITGEDLAVASPVFGALVCVNGNLQNVEGICWDSASKIYAA